MSTIYIEVEVYGGSTIEDICKDAIQLAKKLNISIWFNHNGVELLAHPKGDPKELFEEWEKQISSR